MPDVARALAAAFWPGPLTLVVRATGARSPDEVTGGRDTVGLRVPDHPLALALLDAFGGGVAAPSANRFGRVSPTTAATCAPTSATTSTSCSTAGRAASASSRRSSTAPATRPRSCASAAIDARARRRASLGARGRASATAARSRRRARSRRTTRRDARVEVVDAVDGRTIARATLRHGAGAASASLALDAAPAVAGRTSSSLGRPRDVDEYARVLYRALREADDSGLDVRARGRAAGRAASGAAVVDRLRGRAAAASAQ